MAKPLKNPNAPRWNRKTANLWKMANTRFGFLRDAVKECDLDGVRTHASALAADCGTLATNALRVDPTAVTPVAPAPPHSAPETARRGR